MQQWLHDHPVISYILIFCFVVYIFNSVFRAQKRLPILKEILVHVIMAIGSFVLWILQYDLLPIIQCMAVAVGMMLMLRGRQLYDKWKGNGKTEAKPEAQTGAAAENKLG
ncbi:YlaH-like family protein [Paenibacillus methanolicus]|uniref:YlaH-like protein n=1 Tax=Paenibacillus methanolicus TaxID=582686 RepID=A0A5S5CFP2_9BACL|nr:YlaH-like family protein [Paenibacillus methanolicus]TYP77979.1 YlaH-like protein [Paenibacillus methanolicus]